MELKQTNKKQTLADVIDELNKKFLKEKLGELNEYQTLPTAEEEDDDGR